MVALFKNCFRSLFFDVKKRKTEVKTKLDIFRSSFDALSGMLLDQRTKKTKTLLSLPFVKFMANCTHNHVITRTNHVIAYSFKSWTYIFEKCTVYRYLLRLRQKQNALHLPVFSIFFSTTSPGYRGIRYLISHAWYNTRF